MADKNWQRHRIDLAITAGGRARYFGPHVPPGSTLLRSIFGFSLYQDAHYGGVLAGPTRLELVVGLLAHNDGAPDPDFDPGTEPNSRDWLWAGLIAAEILPYRYTTEKEYRVRFGSPVTQLETGGMRRNDSGLTERVWLITGQLSFVDSGFEQWDGQAYFSLLRLDP